MEYVNRFFLFLLENRKELLTLLFIARVVLLGTEGPPSEPD